MLRWIAAVARSSTRLRGPAQAVDVHQGRAGAGPRAALGLPIIARMYSLRTARPAAALCLVAFTAGCSPALNWRNVPLADTGLVALMPCKPDHAVRPVDLGGRPAELALWGCDADGATFAVSHMRTFGPEAADAALAQWRSAVLARMQAQANPTAAEPFAPPKALALPSAVRTTAQGRRPDGAAITAHAAWFARLQGREVHLYHAVVYAPAARPSVADTFFAGLALQ